MDSVRKNLLIIAIVVLVIVVLLTAYQYIRFYKSEHFVCPKCGYHWKPPLLKMIVAVNAVEGKIIRCPNCGSKEYVEPVKDQE